MRMQNLQNLGIAGSGIALSRSWLATSCGTLYVWESLLGLSADRG